jgi:hypothetical protein
MVSIAQQSLSPPVFLAAAASWAYYTTREHYTLYSLHERDEATERNTISRSPFFYTTLLDNIESRAVQLHQTGENISTNKRKKKKEKQDFARKFFCIEKKKDVKRRLFR